MPDTQLAKRAKAGPVTVIDTHEQIVRDYLNSLEHPPEPRTFNPVEVTEGLEDPIEKLRALAEAKRRASMNELEERFVEVAARWATKNGVGRDAFASLGVPSSVLRRAFSGSASRSAPASAPKTPAAGERSRVSVDTLIDGITHKAPGTSFTVADICAELGGSPATVRKVLERLSAEGEIANRGRDPGYDGRGRAPIVFERV